MFEPGQRVRSEAEPDLGLGLVLRRGGRDLEVAFPAADQVRTYRAASAPLRRVALRPGQWAESRAGRRFQVERVEVRGPHLVYHGDVEPLLEGDLADRVPPGGVLEQLEAGRLGLPSDFELRRDGWALRARALGGALRGLLGARIRLLPHQLYVASRVAAMASPRVLLADEVGLGKTMEAGLVFSALRALGRAGRVLVLAPRPLVHQWLAELVRRFHELFSVLSQEELAEATGRDPFWGARRVILAFEDLEEPLLARAEGHEWDLLIVDEAHHGVSDPQRHRALERLARRSRGLLLLTATPRRGGLATEFAMRRLVDPDRHARWEDSLAERARARAVVEAARAVEAGGPGAFEQVLRLFPEDEGLACRAREGDREGLLRALVDRHGPGRALFRNRRARLRGLFPGRRLVPVPLEPGPEDPRLPWLARFLAANPGRKVLLIAATPRQVTGLQERLRQLSPVRTALFHEGMALVERDRQAAWFSQEGGAQVLLASEIGSEGRNFQAAHHLVLFDIPEHPDLLEQRLGRLDRIGQVEVVQVHALFVVGEESERWFRWHAEGLGSFEEPVEGGEEILAEVAPGLDLARTRQLRDRYRREAEAGVDLLVDRNSFQEEEGRRLQQALERADQDPACASYLARVLARFGVQDEELAEPGLRRIQAGPLMSVDSFPGLRPGERWLATFQRELALAREEVEFLSLDHPLVEGGLSLLLDGGEGVASVARVVHSGPPSALVQLLWVPEALGPAELELVAWLPPEPRTVTLTLGGAPASLPEGPALPLARAMAEALVARLAPRLEALVSRASGILEEGWARSRGEARARAAARLGQERERRVALARLDPASSSRELDGFTVRMERTLEALDLATLRLDAVRLVFLDGPAP